MIRAYFTLITARLLTIGFISRDSHPKNILEELAQEGLYLEDNNGRRIRP